ncbi:LysR family transcriptional regulator [Acetobacter estunensis]|uniref:LysR family transcriptional regulator n=1 Tax=Acetobacter estunensis TaxID=104097 RepID=UPI001C2D1578|nr:LysR family transcriptional regulator [Acetobacter estunensis]MBV1836013.1 LysR family transcriptional regulator [Acetobacter estunensis]
MEVSFDQLQAFVAAVEAGSFSAAGRQLGRAQSAISTQIGNLEADLGLTLFSRDGREAVLTAEGQRLLEEARVVLERRDHMIGVARSLEEGVENRLVVAIDELYPERAMAHVFAEFAARFPHVELEILLPLMEDVGTLVQSGAADIGVMYQQDVPPTSLAFHSIGHVLLRLVCGRDHPLADKPVAWEDLKRYRQILVATRDRTRERKQLRVASDVWWVESNWVILELVGAGVGWAFVCDHVLASSTVSPRIVTPELLFDPSPRQAPLAVVWSKTRPHGPAARWLRQRLGEEKGHFILAGADALT